MKRILTSILALSIVLVFVSCKSKTQSNTIATQFSEQTSFASKRNSTFLESTNSITSSSTSSSLNSTNTRNTNFSSTTAVSKKTNATKQNPTSVTKTTTKQTQTFLIKKEPLPDGVICGYDWLEHIARAATEAELRAYQKEKGLSDDSIWCEHCGRPTVAMSVEGKIVACSAIYGTCIRYFWGGDRTCACCGVVYPVNTCHTCGIPLEIDPLPGTPVHSPAELTSAHRELLVSHAKSIAESFDGGQDNEKFVSLYAFILTDNTAISSQSKCVCFFVFTSEKPYSSKPVYHTGKLCNISILGDNSISYDAKAEEFSHFPSEASAVESYKKIGHSIVKLS